MSLQLSIIGQTTRAEALSLMEWIPTALRDARITLHIELAQAIREITATQQIPDLIVVIQSQPDEYAKRDIDQLGHLAPLARWVVCAGAWCESEGRTRNTWPLAVRVPLRSAASRLICEWRLLGGEQVPPLPLSASREETFNADHDCLTRSAVQLSVLVDSPDPEYSRYLCELLTDAGHVVNPPDGLAEWSPQVILCDLDPWGLARRQVAEQLQGRYPFAPFVGLMNMPEEDPSIQYAVVSKLGNQQQILNAIEQSVLD